MTDQKTVLKQHQNICNIHADRIRLAIAEMTPLLPLSVDKIAKMKPQELAFTELLVSRFAQLQNTMGEQIFPLILENIGEELKGKSFIDMLNLLEKRLYIEDAFHWQEYRKARNAISHEYPDKPHKTLDNLNNVLILAQELVTYWESLSHKIDQILA